VWKSAGSDDHPLGTRSNTRKRAQRRHQAQEEEQRQSKAWSHQSPQDRVRAQSCLAHALGSAGGAQGSSTQHPCVTPQTPRHPHAHHLTPQSAASHITHLTHTPSRRTRCAVLYAHQVVSRLPNARIGARSAAPSNRSPYRWRLPVSVSRGRRGGQPAGGCQAGRCHTGPSPAGDRQGAPRDAGLKAEDGRAAPR